MRANHPRHRALIAFVLSAVLIAAAAADATTITISNLDGAGEGFNDTTPRSPQGGNPGTTLGALRLNAFIEAANRWESVVSSSVVIIADSHFDPLTCSGSGALLGFAGPNSVHRDFAGAPMAATWYSQAQANSLNGTDLAPGTSDLAATFNSDIDNGCLGSITGWYYGFDGNPPSGKLDLIPTLLHEMAHGLGFLTFVDLASGATLAGFDDIFMTFVENHSSGLFYPAMTNGQRVAASTNTGNLHWVGANVAAAAALLSAGTVGTHVRLYAPSPQEPGSSVSHWDTSLTPNEVMEPFDTGSNFRPLTIAAFDDMGWTTFPQPTPTPTPTGTPLCGALPQGGCMTPSVPQKASLSMKDKSPDDKDTFGWKWLKGPAMSPGIFGDPMTTETYELCIYDASSNLIMRATAPAGGICNGKPCWIATSTGFKYVDKDLTPRGVQKIVMKASTVPGASKIIIKGKGVNLELPPTFPLAQPLTAQLLQSGGSFCWEATYSAPASKNEVGPPAQFKDKAD